MRIKLLAATVLLAVSPGLIAANCEKNPNHRDCGEPPSDSGSVYVVRDAVGELVGSVFNFSGVPDKAFIRAEYTDAGGAKHGYSLTINKDHLEASLNSEDLVWDDWSCAGYPSHISLSASSRVHAALTPAFSNEYVAIMDHFTSGFVPPYFIDVINVLPEEAEEYLQGYRATAQGCESIGSVEQWYTPISIQQRDIEANYSAPFSVHLE